VWGLQLVKARSQQSSVEQTFEHFFLVDQDYASTGAKSRHVKSAADLEYVSTGAEERTVRSVEAIFVF
jgi:hypothetical protein